MITEQLIEELDLPDYDKWSEHIGEVDYWWDWILENTVADWLKLGITIETYGKRNTPQISFDIYDRQCGSTGKIYYSDVNDFYKAYADQLMSVSAVYTQMLREGWINVNWDTTRNGGLSVSVDTDGNVDEDYELTFTDGVFAGTSVNALKDAESVDFDEFAECITEIIHDLHKDLLKELTSAYEYDTSEEAYQEWILNEINDAVYTNQTVLNKTTTGE